MTEQIPQVRAADSRNYTGQDGYQYRFICRRENNFMNWVRQGLPVLTRRKPYCPAAMHPEDLAALGLEEGSPIGIRSFAGAIVAVVEGDDALRPRGVSITPGFRSHEPSAKGDPKTSASAATRFVDMVGFDPITGISRMSAIPVAIERWDATGLKPALGSRIAR